MGGRIAIDGKNEICVRGGYTAHAKLLTALASGYEINGLLNSRDLFSFFVRNFSFEFLFQCHYELYCVQRIRSKIINKRRIVGDFVLFYTQLLGYDALNLLFNTAHGDRFSSEEISKNKFWPRIGAVDSTPVAACKGVSP